ncbi:MULTISPECIES: alpha/beta fold hydrolase [Haloarcula]|uniref:Alpha/beta hydrolase fold protein n=1 Tax=Haloarcula amylolytica JCM 13557 TaxID=1227452 RepID=M0KQ09_9EURY|nr:alpha/beta hydrolase [Haloarcula amylolytica]EMA23286.1 alpha/beta hydrolase fold protein [Haloarcula amylolytica JCM 13557]
MPTIQIEDGSLWYEETGTGPPLICLHGGWQDHRSWQAQVDYFADEYRVITVDLRGHGRTGPTGSRRYSVDLFADDLEKLVATLDVDRPVLAGISAGGMVIQTYLDRHPDSARGAVIGGPLQTLPPIELPHGMKQLFSPLPLLSGSLSAVGPKLTFKTLLDSIRMTNGGHWLSLDETVRKQSLNAVDSISATEFQKIFRALYERVAPTLSHVSTPTLVLYGDHEIPLVKRQGERIARTVQTGTAQSIPDSGHLVNQDQSGGFNEACSAFFDGLTKAADDAKGR